MDLLTRMATYVRVVEAGSFAAAARQLRLSSGAVSRQVGDLEARLETTLLRRTTRRMTVTSAGHRYYERCVRILHEVDEANTGERGSHLSGVLQVNAPVTFGLEQVSPHVPALMKRHPGLRIDLRLEDRMIDLALEGVDVAIRVGARPPNSTMLIAHELASFRRILVASPVYLARRGKPRVPEALLKHDALSFGTGASADVWGLENPTRETRVRLNVVFRSNSLHSVRWLAMAGLGVALLPDWFVHRSVQQGVLRVVLPGWQSDPVLVSAIHRKEHRGTKRVRALIEHLKIQYAAGMEGVGPM